MVQKGHCLQFNCLTCETPILFSLFEIEGQHKHLTCSKCGKEYLFESDIMRQLTKFKNLCVQIHESEEILGSTSVGIDVGHHHVQVPYKLLLARLNSNLDLKIGDQTLSITFRLEPSQDVPIALSQQRSEEI